MRAGPKQRQREEERGRPCDGLRRQSRVNSSVTRARAYIRNFTCSVPFYPFSAECRPRALR